MVQTQHNETGQINVYTLDRESHITGFGAHARVVAFSPINGRCYCRVDYLELLARPTNAEILIAARKSEGLTGNWFLLNREAWDTSGTGQIEREDVCLIKATS